ncbi:MAG TPA: hypothetical protein VJL59_09940, partial [Anaerolineales bacterium]|nr:hypothetical protein [Anaerolineales bacterium]
MPLAVIEVCLCAVLVVNGYSSDKRIETDTRGEHPLPSGYPFCPEGASIVEQADNGHQSDKRTRADSSASIR